MGEVMRKNIISVDLTKPLRTEQYGILIASKDSNANMFGVDVFSGGEAVSLTGCTVSGYFTRPDNQVVKLIGGASGNKAIVTLNASCYLVSGRFTLAIKIENNSGFSMTVRIINGIVYATVPEDDPGGNPDEPAVVTLSVDSEGNGTITGSILTVDAEGNATLTGVTVGESNDATLM
jgi:hypothetical protein